MKVTTPNSVAAGKVKVKVTDSGGSSATFTGFSTFEGAPHITSVSHGSAGAGSEEP